MAAVDLLSVQDNVDAEKVNAWIAKGAQPTTTVKNILVANKVISK